MPFLNLVTSPYAAVWSIVKARLDADSALKGCGVRLVYLDGTTEALADLESYASTGAVLFTPKLGQVQWGYESATRAALQVTVQAILPRADSFDHLNLHSALDDAVQPLKDSAYQASLVSAGAETGLVVFNQPLNPISAQAGKDGVMRLQGSFVVDVQKQLLS